MASTQFPFAEGSHAGVPGLLALPRDLFRGGLAGLICGVVFFGFVGRAVMRISALLNPDRRGLLTENGNVIGEVTLQGTLELLLFAGVFGGLLAGFVWVVVREWLPTDPPYRLIAAGVTSACIGSFAVLTEENLDFQLLSPAVLHFAMFLFMIGVAGAAIAWLEPFLEGFLPRGAGPAVVYAVLDAGVGLIVLAILIQAFLQPDSPLFVVAGALLFLLMVDLLAWWSRYLNAQAPGWLGNVAVVAIAVACAAAALHFGMEANEILG